MLEWYLKVNSVLRAIRQKAIDAQSLLADDDKAGAKLVNGYLKTDYQSLRKLWTDAGFPEQDMGNLGRHIGFGDANDYDDILARDLPQVPEGALTVDVAVHKVYREGRNKLAHGEMSGLLEDLAEPRAVGEALLPALFDVVTPVLADLLQNEPNLLKLDEKRAYRLLEAKLAARKANA